ncbi:MAG TPA: NAD(P)-dependent oxidoreductase [Thermoanaerobaculia bacterium]|nr:NAD(P)-dependent oxidoreductase [Thermoanaerobaculia bacterium]
MNETAFLRAGLVGLGTMGRPMARNLRRAGFPLSLFNRTAARAAALAAEDAGGGAVSVASSPSEVARASDVVVTCLPDSPEVEDVLFCPDGVASGAKEGTLVVDCSTIAPEAARSIAERMRARGLGFVDAPVSGGEKGAIDGTLTFFVGGEAADVERARPVFAALGKRVTHLGPSGSGQLGKAVNQVLVACNLVAVSEGLALAAKAGLPLDALHEALTAGAASSWALQVLGRKMIDRDFKPAFAIRHQQKDLAIVLKTARASGVPLPGTALAHQLLAALEAQGRGDDGTQALFTLYEKLSGR